MDVNVARDGRMSVMLMARRMTTASRRCCSASSVSMLMPLSSSDAIHQEHHHEAQNQRGTHSGRTAIQINAFFVRMSVTVSAAGFVVSGMIVRRLLCCSVV